MAKKETTGKPRLELLKRKALEEMAFIREFGIDKYENDEDWKQNPIEHYLGAALRHIYKHLDGEVIDAESSYYHLGHAMVDLMLAIELVNERMRRGIVGVNDSGWEWSQGFSVSAGADDPSVPIKRGDNDY